jgi:hypothetical protein
VASTHNEAYTERKIMQLYTVAQGGCCHPDTFLVVANDVDEAANLVDAFMWDEYERSPEHKYVATMDITIQEIVPRILEMKSSESRD